MFLAAARRRGEEREAYLLEACESELAKRLGDRRMEAFVRGSLGTTFWHLGRLEESGATIERQIAIAGEVGHQRRHAPPESRDALVEKMPRNREIWAIRG